MSARGRNIALIAAGALLIAALAISFTISRADPLSALAREINAFGYALTADDFYVLGGAKDTTIEAVLLAYDEAAEADLAPIVAASEACGFPSNVRAVGDITALLARTHAGVIAVYLRGEKIELCFLQTEEGEILPLK